MATLLALLASPLLPAGAASMSLQPYACTVTGDAAEAGARFQFQIIDAAAGMAVRLKPAEASTFPAAELTFTNLRAELVQPPPLPDTGVADPDQVVLALTAAPIETPFGRVGMILLERMRRDAELAAFDVTLSLDNRSVRADCALAARAEPARDADADADADAHAASP